MSLNMVKIFLNGQNIHIKELKTEEVANSFILFITL
jgi:hypothetical protein